MGFTLAMLHNAACLAMWSLTLSGFGAIGMFVVMLAIGSRLAYAPRD